MKVPITPSVREAVAAGVEETGACAGTKELSNDVLSGLNVLTNLQGERTCGFFYGHAGKVSCRRI